MEKNIKTSLFVTKQITNSIQNALLTNETIVMVDFLNLVRKQIVDREDATFKTVDEFIKVIATTAKHLKSMCDFKKIFLVTKSFTFDKEILYMQTLVIIMWSFLTAVPEWENKVCLVAVNGINDFDKEADDRALFILYNEYSMMYQHVIILSDDNFKNIDTHLSRKTTFNFYWEKKIGETWNSSTMKANNSMLITNTQSKAPVIVIHPNDGIMVTHFL